MSQPLHAPDVASIRPEASTRSPLPRGCAPARGSSPRQLPTAARPAAGGSSVPTCCRSASSARPRPPSHPADTPPPAPISQLGCQAAALHGTARRSTPATNGPPPHRDAPSRSRTRCHPRSSHSRGNLGSAISQRCSWSDPPARPSPPALRQRRLRSTVPHPVARPPKAAACAPHSRTHR